MADKKKLGDYIMIEMGKVPVEIKRGNMTDSEWEKVKKNARDAGTLVEDMTGDKLPPSNDDMMRIDRMGKKIEKSLGEKYDRENPDMKDLELSKSEGGGGSLVARAARMAADIVTGAKPSEGTKSSTGRSSAHEKSRMMPELDISPAGDRAAAHEKSRMMPELDISPAGDRAAAHEKTRRMPELDISPSNDITQEDVDAFETRKALAKSVKENEAAAQMKEGIDFTTPESNLAAAAHKRAGEPPSFEQVTEASPATVTGTVTDNQDTSVTRPVQRFGQSGVPVDEPNPTVEPSLIQRIDQFGNDLAAPLRDGAAALGRIFTPSQAPNEQQLAAREDSMPSSAAPTQVGAPVPAPPPLASEAPPPGAGGSFSARVKTSTPGSGELPPPADPFAEERKRMIAAADGAKSAHDELRKVEESRLKAESKILDDKITFTAKNEEKRLAAMNAYEETLARGQTTMNSIADERRALMNTSVDPDAYFTKGGIGRGVLSVISGALFGWVGQGPQFLQRLDNLAQQEVKNQQDELARKSGELSLIAGDKKNVIAMAREQGMNAIESLAAARVSFFQSVQDQIAKVAAENPMLQEQAKLQMAKIDEKLAGDLMTLKQATQMAAHQNVQDRVAMMNANTNRMEASARVSAAGGGGKGKLMPEAAIKTLDAYAGNLQSIVQMRDLARNGGWWDRTKQKVAQNEPFGYADEKGAEMQFNAAKNNWMTNAAKGALQKEEVQRLQPLLGERGQIKVDPVPNLNLAGKLALEQLDRSIRMHSQQGWDVSDAVGERNRLAAQLQQDGAAPSYAKGR